MLRGSYRVGVFLALADAYDRGMNRRSFLFSALCIPLALRGHSERRERLLGFKGRRLSDRPGDVWQIEVTTDRRRFKIHRPGVTVCQMKKFLGLLGECLPARLP